MPNLKDEFKKEFYKANPELKFILEPKEAIKDAIVNSIGGNNKTIRKLASSAFDYCEKSIFDSDDEYKEEDEEYQEDEL